MEENPKVKYLGRAEISGFLPSTSYAETVPGSGEKVSVQPSAAASSRGDSAGDLYWATNAREVAGGYRS